MSLRKWIAAVGGVSAVSRLLGIGRSSIYDWLNGAAQPRAQTIQRIVELSKGVVTHADVIAETMPRRGARGLRKC